MTFDRNVAKPSSSELTTNFILHNTGAEMHLTSLSILVRGGYWAQPTSNLLAASVKEKCLRDLHDDWERAGYWHFDLIVLNGVSR